MNTERQENENVVILDCENLTSSTVTRNNVFGAIHKQLLDRLAKQICESVEREKLRRDKWSFEQDMEGLKGNDNFPLNYFITGKRGSGKTTFLRQVVKKIESEDSRDVKIKFLHWYDPSESFGISQDFFIEVAAAVKTKFQRIFEEENRYSSKYDASLEFQREMQKLDKAIVRFSQGREALSGLSEHRAANLRIDDPEMNKEIKRNFKKCMRLLCGLYHVDAFVLVIDDIDIRTEQCHNVLENLRLFISNEYLAVLMAGDRTINIERVRERFFKEYDYKYHVCDEQGREERFSYIVSHAAQYFTKLFPVKQQFELRSLYTLSHKRNRVRVELIIDKSNQNQPLEDWLKEIFCIAISIDEAEARSYVDTFMSLPLRNIIQILEYWMREGILDKLEQLKTEDSDTEKQTGQKESEQTEHSKAQIEFLVRTALNRSLQDQLPDWSCNYEVLDSDDGRAYYALLLRLCQDTGDLEHGFYLSDETERGSRYRYLTLVLAANFKRHVKDLKGFLSYLFYGPASVALYAEALAQFKRAWKSSDSVLETQKELRKSFEEYLRVGNWQSASRWARHANMIWCHDLDGHHVHSGIVRICDPWVIHKLNLYINNEEQCSSEYKYEKALALIVSMNKSDSRDNSYYISIYSYLAYILRCVECCDRAMKSCKNNEDEFKKRASDELFSLTKSYVPIKSCRSPEWQTENRTKNVENDEIIEIDDEFFWPDEGKFKKISSIMESIARWYVKMKGAESTMQKNDNIGPHVMGGIWSIFYNQLRAISYAVTKEMAMKAIFPPSNKFSTDEPESNLQVSQERGAMVGSDSTDKPESNLQVSQERGAMVGSDSTDKPESNLQVSQEREAVAGSDSTDKPKSYLQVFQKAIKSFVTYAVQEKESSATRFFIHMIGTFPLTAHFGIDIETPSTKKATPTNELNS